MRSGAGHELHSLVGHGIRQVRGHRRNTYAHPNRRFHAGIPMGAKTVRMPAKVTTKPRVAFVRDTSGSMEEADLSALTSEVVAIARRLGIRGDELTIIDVDMGVARVAAYRGVDTMRQVAGRGGTDMCVGIDYALTQLPKPVDVIIVGTDGETPWPRAEVGIPVIACVVAHPQSSVLDDVPDWIRTVRVTPQTVGA